MILRISLVLALVAITTQAGATLVSFKDAALEAVVRKSPVILVVERAPPQPSDKPPRFTLYSVVEALKGTAAPKTILMIAPAYAAIHDMIGKHIAEHGYEGVPSMIEDSYKSSLSEKQFDKEKRVIVFLQCADPQRLEACELSANSAYESLKKRDAVIAAIKAPPPK